MSLPQNKNSMANYRRKPFEVFYRNFLILFVSCFSFVKGNASGREICPQANAVKTITKTIYHQGIKRIYHIYLPSNFNREMPAPMIIALHGGGGKGSKFETGTTNGTLTAAADKQGVVLVFPEGMNKHWNDGRTEIFKKKKAYDDVAFISKVIDAMIQYYHIDSQRIYATGISNGGFMAIRLALELPEKIAAIAPVAAQLTKALENKKPVLPVSIMMLNGTLDPLVPFAGGSIKVFKFSKSRGEVLSVAATIEHFKEYNKCKMPLEKKLVPDKVADDGTRIEIQSYTTCEKETEVISVKVIGGGHTWPGGKQYLKPRWVGTVSREINASEMIVNFFLKHARKKLTKRQ
ncbi:MAG TPA: esterase [Flavobacteriia bacterium]|nr:esterase [Flavobacteriia bacterium]